MEAGALRAAVRDGAAGRIAVSGLRQSLPVTSARAAAIGLAVMLTGCGTYQPLPLARQASLAPGLAGLATQVPAVAAGAAPRRIDVGRPLDISDIGLLAILNDPDLKSEWGDMGVAQAGLVQASLLPNPTASLGCAALLGGPGSAPAYTASLSQDIAALVTYRARVHAARAHVAEVNATLLWQEWQVGQKARLLALDIYYGERSLALTRQELRLTSDEAQQAQAATQAGNLALGALAPLLAAQAMAAQALITLNVEQIKQWQALDALLGLAPDARFAIAAPELPPPPVQLAPLIARIPLQRPDIIALQLGYSAAEAGMRAAILGQFPAFLLGGSWGSDTTGVSSAGPSITFDLPIFDRNQGKITNAQATRLLLHAQYRARLDNAVGTARGIAAQERMLADELPQARQAARDAENFARSAEAAYAQNNIDQIALTDYQTTALQRDLELISLERAVGEDRLALDVELGLGLPATRLAAPNQTDQQ